MVFCIPPWTSTEKRFRLNIYRSCGMQIVMKLKLTISSLQKENSALTRAFLYLSTGGDWERAIAELPAHVSQQLPAVTPDQNRQHLHSAGGHSSGNSGRPSTSGPYEEHLRSLSEPTCIVSDAPSNARSSEEFFMASSLRRSGSKELHCSHPPGYTPGSNSSRDVEQVPGMLSNNSAARIDPSTLPHRRCSASIQSSASNVGPDLQGLLNQFPALAEMEAEFQTMLVSRPSTGCVTTRWSLLAPLINLHLNARVCNCVRIHHLKNPQRVNGTLEASLVLKVFMVVFRTIAS